ncbi:dTDP-4-dehydrorhamnose reductase [Agrobacterium tumefaciens]|uniref:dTDP-4-dehydrorhamnose reductase n=1 Tax=Agrobacterium tumefaciens TaxID=358 RepID=A0AA44F2V6_AGRTU|nr:dTDP-4-dehydrorhamnose reductase [Agrobacterium tumefaciens]NSL24008.1 dTDP-4-dehydrorhamnose reductase [Agrobacterium tumefaciens]NTB87269.1 dTDP-4-dehydrorhamnose reductase [Agrobacterium tumefaciens]NTC16265.1 dTDP-4-dehydrorhamnose reductase [Agrobacterium tumefaciens]NTC27787.1 dTDP-4-dehydrorhamnose reductase [Agrobacterium tumefaciens]NTC53442.1 dTDP-4-dehydrorhamnose reductase [Agrobacterium tumefaciens]
MRIAVTGKHGQVVSSLGEKACNRNVEVIKLGRPEFDLLEPAGFKEAIFRMTPDVIVSAAAYTAVDKAESDEDSAFAINGRGPRALAEVAKLAGIPIIHISTDYVFSGDKDGPYFETDEADPISVYGRSKLDGEIGISEANPDHAILRTAWVYSPFGQNFLKTMLRLAETRDVVNVVSDQYGTPTSALDIADAILYASEQLMRDTDQRLRGIFHLTGGGEASWADFAEVIFDTFAEKTGKKVAVNRITTREYPTSAKRPFNSRLSGDKLSDVYGIKLPQWEISARAVARRLLALDQSHGGAQQTL